MAQTFTRLYSELTNSDFSCVPDGLHHLHEIYQFVESRYSELCDDSIICRDVHKTTDNSPEWQHRVQSALGYRKNRGRVDKTGLERGYWRLGKSDTDTPSRTRFTREETVLCAYAAQYQEEDFGGLDRILETISPASRNFGSLRMKRNNIISMLDEEGIDRENDYAGLTGKVAGQTGRRTAWKLIEPLTITPKLEFLSLCISIIEEGANNSDYSTDEEYFEGAMGIVRSKRYERNRAGRDACISHYGAVCKVCLFDFEKNYGVLGKGFIHVHHIIPVSIRNKKYRLDPIKDLIPVCPNCHCMIHKGNTTRDWKEIRNLINGDKSN